MQQPEVVQDTWKKVSYVLTDGLPVHLQKGYHPFPSSAHTHSFGSQEDILEGHHEVNGAFQGEVSAHSLQRNEKQERSHHCSVAALQNIKHVCFGVCLHAKPISQQPQSHMRTHTVTHTQTHVRDFKGPSPMLSRLVQTTSEFLVINSCKANTPSLCCWTLSSVLAAPSYFPAAVNHLPV